ncbi:hypothetical protein IJT93_04265 [bacterium]|nr:hypothetical protein [bacterium]
MKNINKIFILILGIITLGLSLTEAVSADHRKPEPNCRVTVHNDSCYEIYVMIDDRNEGKLYKNYSHEYRVERFGTIRVEAEVGGNTARKSVDFRPSSQTAEVTFKTDDFPDMPKYKIP